MKYTLAILAMFVCASAMAEEGRVSQAQLADFGLAGMSDISDAEGTEIRGQGFAFAASVSGSGVPGAFNISPAAALGQNSAGAVSGSSSSIEASGLFGGFGGFGGFIGFFDVQATVSSGGFAFASAN